MTLDVERLRLGKKGGSLVSTPIRKGPPRHRPGERFVKGRIPLNWLRTAAHQPGKAIIVALELWFRAGVEMSRTVRISLSNLQVDPKLNRSSASRGLAALERTGLVTVVRRSGRKPTVTLQHAVSEEPRHLGIAQ